MLLEATLYWLLIFIFTVNAHPQEHVADFTYHDGSILCTQIAAAKTADFYNHNYVANLNQLACPPKAQFILEISSNNNNRLHHERLFRPDPCDYVTLEFNGQHVLAHKDQLPNYQPQYDERLVRLGLVSSWLRRFFDVDCYAHQSFFS